MTINNNIWFFSNINVDLYNINQHFMLIYIYKSAIIVLATVSFDWTLVRFFADSNYCPVALMSWPLTKWQTDFFVNKKQLNFNFLIFFSPLVWHHHPFISLAISCYIRLKYPQLLQFETFWGWHVTRASHKRAFARKN